MATYDRPLHILTTHVSEFGGSYLKKARDTGLTPEKVGEIGKSTLWKGHHDAEVWQYQSPKSGRVFWVVVSEHQVALDGFEKHEVVLDVMPTEADWPVIYRASRPLALGYR